MIFLLYTGSYVTENEGNTKTCFNSNIAKGTTDPRVKLISLVQTQIIIKFHLQNLNQASTPKSQPNISIYIKLKIQDIDQTQLQKLNHDSTS